MTINARRVDDDVQRQCCSDVMMDTMQAAG